MKVEDASASKLPAGLCGEDSHVASKDHVVDIEFIQNFDHLGIFRGAAFVTNHAKWDTELFCEFAEFLAIRNHDSHFAAYQTISYRLEHGTGSVFNKGAAESKARFFGVLLAAPNPDCQLGVVPNLLHRVHEWGKFLGVDVHAAQHGEDLLLVMVVHLDFSDPRTSAGNMVDDWVCESSVVWPEGRDDNFHRDFCGVLGCE